MSKRSIIILSIVAVILTVVVLSFTSLNNYLQEKIKTRLDSYINSSEKGLYHYSYESINIHVLERRVSIGGVRIEPKKIALDSIEDDKLRALVSVEIGEVALHDLFIYPLLANNTIEVEDIQISDTHLHYIFDREVEPKPSTFMISNLFSDKLKGALIHDFELKNASVSMSDGELSDSVYLRIDSVDISINEILMDESTVQNQQPFDYGSIKVLARKFSGDFIKNYSVSSGPILISSEDSTVKIIDLKFAPTTIMKSDMEKQFARAVFQIGVKELLLSSINISSWDELGALEINKISISEPLFQISVDKKWPKPMNEKPLPSTSIRSIPIPLIIDTIDIKQGNVRFQQIGDVDKPTLKLKFGQINSKLTNITNDSLLLEKNARLAFNASTMFMDSARLNLQIVFNLLAPDDAYHVNVKMDEMPFSVVNQILEDQANVQIDGKVNNLKAEFEANKHNAKGILDLDYSDLKLKMHKTKVTESGTKVKSSWLLNTMINPILRTNNNIDQPNFKQGEISYDRPLDIAFFGMIWHSTKTGLMSTLLPGKGQKTETTESNKKEEVKKTQKKHKKKQS